MGTGFWEEGGRDKLREKRRGEFRGEPKMPKPDLREREKGREEVEVGE